MKVFITGITGYLGGSVASCLKAEGATVTGLVRRADQAELMEAAGFRSVIGSLDDGRLLASSAALADVVVNAASSDHAMAVDALIEGLAGTGKTLVHSSGSSLIADDAHGEYGDRIHDEGTPLMPVPQKAHRLAIDTAVRRSALRGLRPMVLCNSLIYGEGLGAKKDSIQIPFLAAQASRSGARYIGPGRNITSSVHIGDVVRAYHLAIERGRSGAFYFIESGEVSFGDMVRLLNRLHGRPAEGSWTIDEASAVLGNEKARFTFGSNTRMRGIATRHDLDWTPTGPTALAFLSDRYAK